MNGLRFQLAACLLLFSVGVALCEPRDWKHLPPIEPLTSERESWDGKHLPSIEPLTFVEESASSEEPDASSKDSSPKKEKLPVQPKPVSPIPVGVGHLPPPGPAPSGVQHFHAPGKGSTEPIDPNLPFVFPGVGEFNVAHPEGHVEEEEHSLFLEAIEYVPEQLTKLDRPLAWFFGCLLHAEHDSPKTELDEHPIGLQPIPERPPLFVELNEKFLAPGWLEQGIELPTGAVWRPSFWVFGQYRTAVQYFDTNRPQDPISEWTHRLDLFGQLNLTGTERVLIGLRPLDKEVTSSRQFTSVDFRDEGFINGFNNNIQTLFFEGDFGEIFPCLDPHDVKGLDWGFSVGRMPLLAQQGLLLAEDAIDAVTVTRNTLNGHGILNLRATGVFAWDSINRSSSTGAPNTRDDSSLMYALLTETDIAKSTINADVVFVDGGSTTGDMFVFGLSAIQRHYFPHNTYNTSFHVLASFPTGPTTPFADQGELLFSQISWTPHKTDDLIYVNTYWAIDRFTSPARGTLVGGPLGLTGIAFAAPGIGRAGPAIGNDANDYVGGSLGYQLFFEHHRQQVICELGWRTQTEGPNRAAIAGMVRWQKALGQHCILLLDGFVGKQESRSATIGSRIEMLFRF